MKLEYDVEELLAARVVRRRAMYLCFIGTPVIVAGRALWVGWADAEKDLTERQEATFANLDSLKRHYADSIRNAQATLKAEVDRAHGEVTDAKADRLALQAQSKNDREAFNSTMSRYGGFANA